MKRKLLAALILFTGLSVYFTLSASAYVDPATTSILIQSLAGVGAVVITGVVVLWVTLKRRVKKARHIEDKSTEVEDEFRVVGENGEAAPEATEEKAADKTGEEKPADAEEEIDFGTEDE